jgi:hypothetical protein
LSLYLPDLPSLPFHEMRENCPWFLQFLPSHEHANFLVPSHALQESLLAMTRHAFLLPCYFVLPLNLVLDVHCRRVLECTGSHSRSTKG